MKNEKLQDSLTYIHNEYTYIPTDFLTAGRLTLTKKEGIEFTESIRANGFYDPILIDRDHNIIDGNKRYFAAVRLGLEVIPCLFPENRHIPSYAPYLSTARSEFSHYFSKASAISKLTDKHLLTQEAVAALLGRSQSYIANKLRLLKFTPAQIKLITDGELTERHARALLKIRDAELRTAAIEHIINAAMNVSETEEYIDGLSEPSYDLHDSNSDSIYKTMRNIDNITYTAHNMGVLLKMNRSEDSTSVNYTIKIFK